MMTWAAIVLPINSQVNECMYIFMMGFVIFNFQVFTHWILRFYVSIVAMEVFSILHIIYARFKYSKTEN